MRLAAEADLMRALGRCERLFAGSPIPPSATSLLGIVDNQEFYLYQNSLFFQQVRFTDYLIYVLYVYETL